MINYRKDKVSKEILKEVSNILMKKIQNPDLIKITLTDILLTPDLQKATIFYTFLTNTASNKKRTKNALVKAIGLIRYELAKKIKLYKIPEISFEIDSSVDYGSRVDKILRRIKKERNSG